MQTIVKAKLEAMLDSWLETVCESDECPTGYIHDSLVSEMAAAAEAVYDASMNGQLFAKTA